MSKRPATRILLIDRHPGRDRLRAGLEGSGYSVVTAKALEEAESALRQGFDPGAVVLGDLGGISVLEAVAPLRKVRANLPVVAVLEQAEDAGAVEIERYATVARSAAIDELDSALMRARGESEAPSAEPGTAEALIAAAPAMLAIRKLVQQVADTDVPVLITGASGVGKEVIARALHRQSDRRGPFVKVNCAALPDQLLESELFGYEPGAFTGAERKKPGKFELAHAGTILLDEIGEISGGTQAKLLQVLQDGCYFRLGGDREIRVDARVVASTNRRLEEAMTDGSFRPDLFYRLNVVRIEVPPLRQRREEVPMLARHFVRQYEDEYGRTIGELDEATLAALARHDWPGNVRELENLVRRMVVLEDIEATLESLQSSAAGAHPGGFDVDALIGPDGALPPLKEVSRLAALEVEGELIRRALERTGWNRRRAAELLGISYKALLYKIRDCGISKAAA